MPGSPRPRPRPVQGGETGGRPAAGHRAFRAARKQRARFRAAGTQSRTTGRWRGSTRCISAPTRSIKTVNPAALLKAIEAGEVDLSEQPRTRRHQRPHGHAQVDPARHLDLLPVHERDVALARQCQPAPGDRPFDRPPRAGQASVIRTRSPSSPAAAAARALGACEDRLGYDEVKARECFAAAGSPRLKLACC